MNNPISGDVASLYDCVNMESLALRMKAQKIYIVDKKICRDNVGDVPRKSSNFSEL